MIYFDTSALIRAFRAGKAPKGITRSHTVAEFYATLTGRGVTVELPEGRAQLVLAPAQCVQVIRETFANLQWRDLSPTEALADVTAAVAVNVQGAGIHDWFHVSAARRAKVKQLATLNEKHFQNLPDGMKLVSVTEALKSAPKASEHPVAE